MWLDNRGSSDGGKLLDPVERSPGCVRAGPGPMLRRFAMPRRGGRVLWKTEQPHSLGHLSANGQVRKAAVISVVDAAEAQKLGSGNSG